LNKQMTFQPHREQQDRPQSISATQGIEKRSKGMIRCGHTSAKGLVLSSTPVFQQSIYQAADVSSGLGASPVHRPRLHAALT
jgi:hypothetical protein